MIAVGPRQIDKRRCQSCQRLTDFRSIYIRARVFIETCIFSHRRSVSCGTMARNARPRQPKNTVAKAEQSNNCDDDECERSVSVLPVSKQRRVVSFKAITTPFSTGTHRQVDRLQSLSDPASHVPQRYSQKPEAVREVIRHARCC